MDDFDPIETWPFKDQDWHFTSGVNNAGEVRGLALTGRSVGITATEIRAGLLEELELYAGGLLEVFVDSGAFSEVRFGPAGREVVRPITAADWSKRLELYVRIARAFRCRAYLVAPDAVGDQAETLRRLERYADQIRKLRELGANVLVPVQRGELGPAAFRRRAIEILGFADFVIAIPAKKAATSPAELRAFARELYFEGESELRFHLLGLGPASKRYAPMIEAIRDWHTDAVIYSDAGEIRRKVGRTNGPGGTPRALTAAQDRARARGIVDPAEVKAAGLLEVGLDENRREAQAARRAGWFDPELESAPGVPLEPGCIEYGPGGPFGDEPVQLELEVAPGKVAA